MLSGGNRCNAEKSRVFFCNPCLDLRPKTRKPLRGRRCRPLCSAPGCGSNPGAFSCFPSRARISFTVFWRIPNFFGLLSRTAAAPHGAKRRADKPLRSSLLRVLNGAHTACTRASRGLLLAHEWKRLRLSINFRIFQAQQMIFVVGVAIWIPVLLHGDEPSGFQDLERFLE